MKLRSGIACGVLFLFSLLAVCLSLSAQEDNAPLERAMKKQYAQFEQIPAGKPLWYRGCLHTHSLWSDGTALPELVIQWYRDNGFAFMSLTDHTKLQFGEKWLPESKCPGQIGKAKEKFSDWMETRFANGKTEVRLHTISELMDRFNDPGKFLLIPGHEVNGSIGDRQLHMIAMNVTESIPFLREKSVKNSIAAIEKATVEQGQKSSRQVFSMVNHPEWVHFSVSPEDLIANPQMMFYEICNADSPPRPIGQYNKEFWNREKYYDVILAFRLAKGDPPIYVTATDDAHSYFKPGAIASPGIGWVSVRSNRLTTPAILDAMNRGDFYATTGIELEDLRFDSKSGTFTVCVAAQKGVNYHIQFVGTKKNFSQKKIPMDYPKDQGFPARSGFKYSSQIGQTFSEMDGPVASYILKPDDLYVRAIVTSNKKTKVPARNKPENEILWTQPVMK
ncbi:MAG: hypothetical protein PHQ75_10230 [Thermoguttaceae bacterium]|nr:hypothetical protein [Thermoguttaceae bacterium]